MDQPTTFGPTLLIIEKILGKMKLVSFNNFDNNRAHFHFRLNDGNDNSNDFEFSSNFIKNFNEGHKLTADGSFTKSNDKKIPLLTVNTTFLKK
jgi:hypothetical protein